MELSVRPVRADDTAAWTSLYAHYRAFYRLPVDQAAVDRTWAWVREGEHGLVGLVAVDAADVPIALANLRWFARPSTASLGLYLDDLFTDPAVRGSGAARALLQRASGIAAERGAGVVRWITAEDNATARRLYDQVATQTAWVTYDMAPDSGPVA